MAQVLLHYFSGTGNTFRAASITARMLKKAGCQTRLIDIAAEKPAQTDGLNIFLFPTYGFTTPQVMQDYLRSLPEPGPQARAAILATIGTFSADAHGFEGNSLSTAARLLEKKGWHVFFTEAFSYPANWTQFSN
ncbi:MAG TPA: hypothetical protein PLL10_06630, partial [Elusimicrobiales bacterium]|nr:hypothetical protein [Elusimicrobiales bacterium]